MLAVEKDEHHFQVADIFFVAEVIEVNPAIPAVRPTEPRAGNTGRLSSRTPVVRYPEHDEITWKMKRKCELDCSISQIDTKGGEFYFCRNDLKNEAEFTEYNQSGYIYQSSFNDIE